MSADSSSIMGLFQTEEATLTAIKEIKDRGWQVEEVFSPIPSEKIFESLGKKKSKVGWFTLAGGITGFLSGFALTTFTATQWNLVVSGKPIVSWFPFFIVAFEFTILFAVFGNVLGLLTQVGLPTKMDARYNPACSGSVYGISASGDTEKIKVLMQEKGAEIQ
ncbi:MAG: DUF3341 domain-containing protein [Proteobacteria bacterium]|nr:DUF3341 domain-containing protein [Pseudomonadota bacterium]